MRALPLFVETLSASGQNLFPLTEATLIVCSISTSSPPLSGSWPPVSQWPSLLSCRLQVVFEIFVLRPPVVLHVAHIIPLLERALMPVQAYVNIIALCVCLCSVYVKIIALCVYVCEDNCFEYLCLSREVF